MNITNDVNFWAGMAVKRHHLRHDPPAAGANVTDPGPWFE
jgi:hypothetical protein